MTFYLQYFSYNDENFDVNNNYYQDSNDYIKQLEDSYNQTKDAIFEAMSSGNYNSTSTYKIALSEPKTSQERVSYTKCQGTLFNDTMEEENIDSLLKYFASEEVTVFLLRLSSITLEEEFESNWHMFIDSSNKIAKCDADDEWKFIHKPTRDIYFSLKNKNNEIVYGKLVNCRIEENISLYENVIIAEQLVFLKNLE